jgi:hypothetical protein
MSCRALLLTLRRRMRFPSCGASTGNFVDSSPAVANGVVYIGSDDNKLYAFDLAGGLATPSRPDRSSLHPDYRLRQQR